MLKKSLLLFKIFLVKATKLVSSLFVCFIKAYFFLVSASYKIQINFEKLFISNYLTYFFLLCRVMATLFLFIRKKFFRRYRKYLGIFLEAKGTIAQCFLSYSVAESCFQKKTFFLMWCTILHVKQSQSSSNNYYNKLDRGHVNIIFSFCPYILKAGGKFELRLNLFTYDSEKNNKLWPNITRNETPEKLGNYLKVKDHKFKIELTMLCRFTRPTFKFWIKIYLLMPSQWESVTMENSLFLKIVP